MKRLLHLLLPLLLLIGIKVNAQQPGQLDAGFNLGGGANGIVYTTALQPDGKVIIGGDFFSYNGTTAYCIARLNADGSLDATFTPGTGATGANSSVRAVALQPDGKIIIGGAFTSYNGVPRNRIARLNADGSLDVSFNPSSGSNSIVRTATLQPDGKIIIGGDFSSYNGASRNHIARLNVNGSLDASFAPGTGANSAVLTAALQPDGKAIIGGGFLSYNGTSRNNIARLNADGSLDATFTPGSGANNIVVTAALQPDGKIIIGGLFTSYNSVARLNTDGSLDATFTSGANYHVQTVALQPDGKIIIGGEFTSYHFASRNYIARLNADGSLDAPFNPSTGANGTVWTTALQPDGKIIIGGDFFNYNGTSRNRVARLNVDGSLDASFNPGFGANGTVWTAALQPDGKIIIGGIFGSYNFTAIYGLARLNADGSLDATFTSGANGAVRTVALQPDGKIIIGGGFLPGYIARLNADGSLDATFTSGSGLDNAVITAALQPDGKIILGGEFTNYNGITCNRLARLNANGSRDVNFAPGTGANSTIRTVVLQPDGKIIIGGAFTSYNNIGRNQLARVFGSFVSGIAKGEKGYSLSFYPNPSQGFFQLQLSGIKASEAELTVKDLAGKTILRKDIKATEGMVKTAVDLKVTTGIYLLQVKVDRQTFIRKVVIQ